MKTIFFITAFVFMLSALPAQAQEKLLIDDFEGPIYTGPSGTVGTGTTEYAILEITADTDIKYSGEQSLKVTFNTGSGKGTAWIAKGFDLEESSGAGWPVNPKDIEWNKYSGFSFYIYGGNSGNKIKLHVTDNGSEIFEYVFTDDFIGWKDITCNFNDFYAGPWQPENADKNNKIDFPVKSFTFIFPSGETGTLYIDRAELTGK